MGDKGCFSHIIGGAVKGIIMGGILGALAGVALRQRSQGVITLAVQGAQILGVVKLFAFYADPENWGKEFPECNGSKQSPVDIKTKTLVKRNTKKPLKWNSYSIEPRSAVTENSKHSIHLNGNWKNSEETPFISQGPLEKRYYFSQLHFHWGKRNDRGSEHLIDGKSYPLEMHVVHDRVPEDRNDTQLIVIGYMFQLIKNDNPNLKPILDGAREVQGSKKRKFNIKPFSLDTIVKPFSEDYVTYKGSLTTPPCTEGVVWIINSKPLGISERQLNILRNSVRGGKSNKGIDNYRPTQPLNGRKIYYVPCKK